MATVANIIDRHPLSRFQITTITLCGLVLFLDGFDAQTIGFLAPFISGTTRIPLNTFGPIFSASLVGLMIAAMATGPIADRWGRKWPIIFSSFTLAIFSILTAHATSFNQLLIFRFLTGLGLGGALPNTVALAAEYMPKRLLSALVAVLFAGVPLGGFVCGLLSSAIAPVWGWQAVFYFGGALPLVIAFLLIFVLPESVQFLATDKKNASKISYLLDRIASGSGRQVDAGSLASARERKGVPMRHLFTDGRAAGTILLWVPNFLNLLLMYVIVSWLPALLTEAGMSVTAGVTATAFFSLGGIIGSLLEGVLIIRFGAGRILLGEFGLASLFIGALALISHQFTLVIAVTSLLGFFVVGAQAGLNVLAARFYPTAVRSTGVGWALGVGRVGSIVGPMLAGTLLSSGWHPRQILFGGGVSALCACLAIALSYRVSDSASPLSAQA